MSDPIELTEPIPTTGPLTPAQSMALCRGCDRCCTYVSVEVDAPSAPWQYDQYVWLLEHRGVWMYVEKGDHWYVQFETVCEQLADDGRCRIHGRHPVLCQEYDARSCERRGELTRIVARFHKGDDLVRWLEAKRPAHYRRWKEWFDRAHAPAAAGAAGPGAGGAAGGPDAGDAAGGPDAMRRTERYEMPPPPASPFAAAEPVTLRRGRPPRAVAPRRA